MNQCKESMNQQGHFLIARARPNSYSPIYQYPQFNQQCEQKPDPFYYQSVHVDRMRNQSVPEDLVLEGDQNQRNQVNSNSQVTNQQEGMKFVKLPSIEYLVQEQERKTRSVALMLFKLHNLSDFYKSKPSCSSREVISQKTLDTGNHQLKELFREHNNRTKHLSNMKNAIFIQQPCPQELGMFNLQKGISRKAFLSKNQLAYTEKSLNTKLEDDIAQEQHQLNLLKQKNRQLEQLFFQLKNVNNLKISQYTFQKQAMYVLKQIIQKMRIIKQFEYQ